MGHATYVFARPNDVEQFVRLYVRTSKEDIRNNRDGIAERLGSLGRVMHGANPRRWLRALKERIGESVDYSLSLS